MINMSHSESGGKCPTWDGIYHLANVCSSRLVGMRKSYFTDPLPPDAETQGYTVERSKKRHAGR
jgi:hypothetical protein